jgi:hypothetical protein
VPATVHPQFTINDPVNGLIEDVAPYDFATIYNLLPLWNASSPIDGTGQTIAIAGTSDINLTDVASFRSVFGLPANPVPQQIMGANGLDPGICTSTSPTAVCGIGDLIENSLDVEWSGAVAKGAQIVLVTSGSKSATDDTVYDSSNYVVQNNTAPILNVSYGECELGMGTAANALINSLWQTASSEGIAVFVAAGDSGSAACDQGDSSPLTLAYAEYGLAVSGVASTPYDTAVGGTDFGWCKPTINSSGNVVGCSSSLPYWSTSNNPATGASALGYVPEIPWNDTCASPTSTAYLVSIATLIGVGGVNTPETACNFVAQDYYYPIYLYYGVDLSFFVNVVGGGGGASNCTTGNGQTVASCSGGYAKPSWQTSVPGIPSDGARDIPDVSFFASNGMWDSAYLICVSEAGSACVSSTTITSEPVYQEIGGTSVASPAMAGVMALINQKTGAAQGNPNTQLYQLAAKQSYGACSAEGPPGSSCYFNDIDAGDYSQPGTNAQPCLAGSPNCTVMNSGDSLGILSGYNSGTGYDLATGLGSLNVANVVNAWVSDKGTATATVTVTPAQGSVTVNQSLNVTVTVTGSSGTPTGTVTLTGGGYTSSGTLSGGSYTFAIPANSLRGGTDTLKVSYSGDPTYAAATGTASVTVNTLTPSVAVQTYPTTADLFTIINVGVTVTGAGPTPTGTVQLTGGGYTSGICTLTGSAQCSFNTPRESLSVGSDTLTVTYSGDSNYSPASGTAAVTITKATPTVTVTPASSSITTTQSLSVPVAVSYTFNSGAPTPSGTVTLSSGSYTSAAATLSGGSATINIPAGSLATGSDTLTVTYTPDSGSSPVYSSATGTAAVAVTTSAKTTPTVTVTPQSASITTVQAVAVTVAVSGGSGNPTPSGSVTLSSGSYVSAAATLSNGSATINILAGSLATGSDSLTAAYTPDSTGSSTYNSATGSGAITVTKATATVTVTPASSSIDSNQSLSVTASVAGGGPTPTGTVTLSGGGYTSPAQTLAGSGSCTSASCVFTISANSLSAGTDTLTVTYTGDANYAAATGTNSVTVILSVFTLSASTPAAIASPGGNTTSTVTVGSTTGYSGTVTLSCSLTSGPANSVADTPSCSGSSAPVSVGGTATFTVTTSPVQTGELVYPQPGGKGRGWEGAGGGALLAVLLFLGIPARRRSWRSMLGVLVLMAALGSLAGCGGGGSTITGPTDPGTALGTYTFTVTGTGTPAVSPVPSTTFQVTVE